MLYKVYKSCVNLIRENDKMSEPLHERFHFDTDLKNKTVLGGFVSIAITAYVLNIAIVKGITIYE